MGRAWRSHKQVDAGEPTFRRTLTACKSRWSRGGSGSGLRIRNLTTMSAWPRYPTLYEINTWVWLSELSVKAGRSVDLGSVPETEWDTIARFGFDAVWLMGVWERSPAGIAIANQNTTLVADFRRALPDFKPEDNIGSPYCIRRYVVEAHLGGGEGLAIARQEIAKRGKKMRVD